MNGHGCGTTVAREPSHSHYNARANPNRGAKLGERVRDVHCILYKRVDLGEKRGKAAGYAVKVQLSLDDDLYKHILARK